MSLTPTEELRTAGLRILHPADVDVETGTFQTRHHRIRKIHLRGPWVTSASDPGSAVRYGIRILIFEDPEGGPVGNPVEEGRIRSAPGRFELVPGTVGGLEATIREPVEPAQTPRAAYVKTESRFYFIEWRGPVGAILDTLELEG